MGFHSSEATRLRRRRVRALLASGLVLGVGAGATLAAWTDSEHSQATFTAGRFGIVGSTNGTSFSEHSSAGQAATLNFQVSPTAMAPGTTTYALYSVTTLNPSVAGTVNLTAAATNNAGLGQHLTYGVRTISGTSCNATTYAAGTAVVNAGQPLTAGAAGSQTLQANNGNQVNYCFAVTLPQTALNTAQGLSVTARWEFVAQSS